MWLQAVRFCRQENIWARVSSAPRGAFNTSSSPHAGNQRKSAALTLTITFLFVYTRDCRRALSSLNTHKPIMSDREFSCKSPSCLNTHDVCAQADMFGFTSANDDLSLPKGMTGSYN
jgi:hypothetical protein